MPDVTLAVIILHALWNIWYNTKTHYDTFLTQPPSSQPHLISSPLSHIHPLSQSPYRLQQKDFGQKELELQTLSIMVNKAIAVNGNHFVNGDVSDIAITTRGSSWYFVRWRLTLTPSLAFQPQMFGLHLWLQPSCRPWVRLCSSRHSPLSVSPSPDLVHIAFSTISQPPSLWSPRSHTSPWVPIWDRHLLRSNSGAAIRKWMAWIARSFMFATSIG